MQAPKERINLCSSCGARDHNARTCTQRASKYAQALPLLASHTNQEIAEKLGVSLSNVPWWRKKAGIPRPQPPQPPQPRQKACSTCDQRGHNSQTCPQGPTRYAQAFPLFASHTNQEIVDKLGIPLSTVEYWRGKAGIPQPLPVKPPPQLTDLESKYPGLAARLGTEADSDLGRAYGLSRQRIQQLRLQRAIPSVVVPITPEITALLGTIPDTEIHERYPQISVYRLHRARQARNIPTAVLPYEQAVKERLENAKDQLGVVPDKRIAKALKVHVETVARYRKKLNIAPVRRGGRARAQA